MTHKSWENSANDRPRWLPSCCMNVVRLPKVLTLCPLLVVLGCLSDFSPDPYTVGIPVADASTGDAGKAARPTRSDASVQAPLVKADAQVGESGDPATPSGPSTPADPSNPSDPTNPATQKNDGGTVTGDVMTPPASAGPCDLTGRYLMTERLGMDALGAKQITHHWHYVELTQVGTKVTFSTSTFCGQDTIGLPPVGVSMDDSAAWPSYMTHRTYGGRVGTSQESASGCDVTFEKKAVVLGATVETYGDLSVTMPTADEKADATNPGWEDWDADNNPGVTLRISGTISGSLYAALRTWTVYDGSIAAVGDTFKLPISDWGQLRSTLGYDGSPLLTADAAPDTDMTQHVVEFARVSEAQVGGDDAAKCKAVRDLAATLTPNAAK